MEIDLLRLSLVTSASVVLIATGVLAVRGTVQRMVLGALLFGLAFYNGIGSSFVDVPSRYSLYYIALLTSAIIGFHVASISSVGLGRVVRNSLRRLRGYLDSPSISAWIILGYLFAAAFPLLWPELQLELLWRPPSPDLKAAFASRFSGVEDPLTRLVRYARLLLTPFFFIALWSLRARILGVAAVLTLALYLEYLPSAYIGRTPVLVHLGVLGIAYWLIYPRHRRKLVILYCSLTPLLAYAMYLYGRVRIGAPLNAVDLNPVQALGSLLQSEWSYPRNVGVLLLESGVRADLGDYFRWMMTLPVPKLIIGTVEGARINYEISEFVLGRSIEESGAYVALPGLVGESIYIFGPRLFWLHGIAAGAAAGLTVRLVDRVPEFAFLTAYLVMLFGYVLNRGGVAAFLPRLVNEFLLLALLIAFSVLALQRGKIRHGAWSRYILRDTS